MMAHAFQSLGLFNADRARWVIDGATLRIEFNKARVSKMILSRR
jgi:hypothetical protein